MNKKGYKMKKQDYVESECYAFMIDTEEIISYDEALSLDLKDKYHTEICKTRKYLGLGYICNTTLTNTVSCSSELSLIYVYK